MAVFSEGEVDRDLRKIFPQFEKKVKGHVLAWIKLYECQREAALTSLVALIFRACQCPIKVNEDIPDDMTWGHYLGNIEDVLDDDEREVPTIEIKEDKEFSYARNLSNFITYMMMESQHDILIDDYFSLNVLELLKVLSHSQYRSFRHGSTLIAFKMVTTMSNIMKILVKHLADCGRQLSLETSKSVERRSTERMENLQSSFTVADIESSKIEEILTEFYEEVIKDRFRDICGTIRLICLEELQVWFNLHGKFYLKQKYLLHLKNFLCDTKATVLKPTLKVVQFIYEKCDFEDMDAFTKTILNRILTLSMNDSDSVSCSAIKVASAIVERNSLIIKEDEKGFLKSLVLSPEFKVSCQAAAFFHELIRNDLKDEIGNNRNVPTLYLLQLKDFIIKNNASKKIDLLAEAMLSVQGSYLLTWKSYVVILLADEFKVKAPHILQGLPNEVVSSLNDEDEKIFVSLMLSSMRQVFTQESPRCRKEIKIKIPKAFQQRREDCVKSCEILWEFIPRLMEKFMSDNSIINDLLLICSMIDSSCCTRNEDIHLIGEVFKKLMKAQVEVQVHIKGAKAVAHWCEGNNMFKLFVLKPFLDDISSKWRKSLKSYREMYRKKQLSSSPESDEESEEINLKFALEKYCSILWAFSSHFSLDEYVDLNELFELSQGQFKKDYSVPEQVMEFSYKTLHAIILREARDGQSELFKPLVEDFTTLGGIILQGDFKCSFKHMVVMCLCENICMLRYLMATSPPWITECYEFVAVQLVKYFSGMVCRKDGLNNLSKKEEDEFITNLLTLIQKKVLPRQAVVYALMYCNKEPMKRFSEMMKETMSAVQSWGMNDFAEFLHEALSFSFQAILCGDDDVAKKNELFQELQELANLLRRNYAPTLTKNKDAAVKFHLHGLDFATSLRDDFVNPLYAAPYIIILSIFVPVIHQSDLKMLAVHLRRRLNELKENTNPDPNDMEWFNQYLQHLSP